MVARRLSHRFVATGLFPPSSDSWLPTHSTHKFTRATAWGGAIPGVRSSDGWLLAHSRESAIALSVIIVHCRKTRGTIGKSAPVPSYPSTVLEISDGMLVRATCPRFKPSRELMTQTLLAAEERSFCDARKDSGGSKRPWRLVDLVAAN